MIFDSWDCSLTTLAPGRSSLIATRIITHSDFFAVKIRLMPQACDEEQNLGRW